MWVWRWIDRVCLYIIQDVHHNQKWTWLHPNCTCRKKGCGCKWSCEGCVLQLIYQWISSISYEYCEKHIRMGQNSKIGTVLLLFFIHKMLIFISYRYLWVDKENSDVKKNPMIISIINFLSNFRMGKTFPWKVFTC